MTTPTTLEAEIRDILQSVHDDAVSPIHDPALGYSEQAVDALLALIQKVVDKACGEELKGYTNDLYCSGSNTRARRIRASFKDIVEGKTKI